MFPQTSQAISIDTHGGLFLTNAGEARYFTPPGEPSRILGFALARLPVTARAGASVTVPYLSNEPVQISARIASRSAGAPEPIVVTPPARSVTWNGQIASRPASPGRYLIELTATDAAGRISTRQLPITITP